VSPVLEAFADVHPGAPPDADGRVLSETSGGVKRNFRVLSRRNPIRPGKALPFRALEITAMPRFVPRRSTADAVQGDGAGSRGVLVGHYGVAVDVELADGTQRSVRVARKSGLVVGDDVVVHGERLARGARRHELKRNAPNGGGHGVAVNLDVLGVVVAVEPPPRPGLVDRAVVAARAIGVSPFVVVNKLDLPGGAGVADDFRASLAGEIEVLGVSAATGAGVEAIGALLAAKGRGVLVGPSGVGKSSIVNRLVPGAALRIGALSEAHGTGKHTTTTSRLFRLAGGGELVDTPGVREYGLVDVEPKDLAAYFVGFDAVVGACRFRDCLHEEEPGCAVVAAVEADVVAAERYVSYRTLLDESKGRPR
jgi:ribosome biogenesis GTPase / thiamine phosphate phosphatase